MMKLEQFADQVLSASSPQSAWNKTVSFFESFGFKGAIYGQRQRDVVPTVNDIWFSDRLADWKAAYFEQKDYERDPLFIYAPNLPSQFMTGIHFLPDHAYLNAEDIAVIRRAQEFGLTSGIALRMSRDEDPVVKGWHLVSSFSRPDIEAINTQFGALLHICAAIAHHKIGRLENLSQASLTTREQECLLLLAKGYRTAMIADHLSIKAVTVDLHLRNARTKLGARTREQALANAIATGLIHL
ncbi:LuxR family transcriptional regulator [Roseibium sp. MMSF_3544]|uniref:helix-turn-helix transcriptional regulator n=1 Tax=unclassified Roseibium TaxID=2629323 RepID=UPI00273F662C|nr:LuxR family transcriptional regulator [Roseibium sp. MMSF_3544]